MTDDRIDELFEKHRPGPLRNIERTRRLVREALEVSAPTDAEILANADRLFPRWREDIQERFVLENARAALGLRK